MSEQEEVTGDFNFVPDKTVVISLKAEAPGSWGTALIDVRRHDYSGGSLRALRASVNFDTHITDANIRMPMMNDEQMIIGLETYNHAAPPTYTIRTEE